MRPDREQCAPEGQDRKQVGRGHSGSASEPVRATIYPSDKDRRHRAGGVRVRVVEYRLEGIAEAEPLYRLVTTILDPAQAPAAELAALYHERWEIEGALAGNSRRNSAGRGWCCAARPRNWCGKSSGPAAGAFRGARADVLSRRCGPTRTRTGCPLARRARGPPQGAAVRGAFPLGPGVPCIRRCWTRSWRSAR